MAGAHFIDVYLLYGISQASAYRVFRDVTTEVVKNLSWQSFPSTNVSEEFKKLAVGFALSRAAANPLPGCVASLDGLQVRIERPPREYHPLQFFSRKGFFSLPVQAVVDYQYRFVTCSVLAVGSTHDSIAFQLSDFYKYLEDGNLPRGFWIAGDEAYQCSEFVLVPFSRTVSIEAHDAFNFYLSSHRIHVEQGFGMLKKRWAILQKPLAFDISFSTNVIAAVMKLHNFCINMDSEIQRPTHTEYQRRFAEERLNMWLNWCQNGVDIDEDIFFDVEERSAAAIRAERRSATRQKLVIIVRRENLRRPMIAGPDEVSAISESS